MEYRKCTFLVQKWNLLWWMFFFKKLKNVKSDWLFEELKHVFLLECQIPWNLRRVQSDTGESIKEEWWGNHHLRPSYIAPALPDISGHFIPTFQLAFLAGFQIQYETRKMGLYQTQKLLHSQGNKTWRGPTQWEEIFASYLFKGFWLWEIVKERNLFFPLNTWRVRNFIFYTCTNISKDTKSKENSACY